MRRSIRAIRAARWSILHGKLAGINTAIFSRSGGSLGIGFAIPANMVQAWWSPRRAGGGSAVKRPWLGARLQAVTPEIAESLGLKRPAGALVASVAPQSPGGARRPEDRRRDRRRSTARSSTIPTPSTTASPPSRSAAPRSSVVLRRPGDERRRRARRRRPTRRATRSSSSSRSPFQGAKVANLSPALADELRLDPAARAW